MTDSPAAAGFEAEALPHLDAVYRFALRLSGAPDQAEDLVQETFLRAYKSWGQYTRGTGRPRAGCSRSAATCSCEGESAASDTTRS